MTCNGSTPRMLARALEPALECRAALLSPSTGIVDSHGLMLSLLGEAERHGAMLALGKARVLGGPRGAIDGIVLRHRQRRGRAAR
jgi:L-2-hydroxyglutarate oxidase LhgO